METDTLKDALVSALDGVLDGAKEDLEQYAAAMAIDLAEAAAVGDEDLVNTVHMQAQALAERHRLSASDAGWSTLQSVIRFALGVL